MTMETAQQLREKLTFEQQARFDALYPQREKKEGTATVLALPLLGTFGIEHFYLGNTLRGVLSLLFSWTLIPTVLAIIDLLTGEVKKQVAHANSRVALDVYNNVIKNTVKDQVPAAAAAVVAPPVIPTPAPAPEPVVEAPSTTVVVTEAVVPPAEEAVAVVAADSIPDVVEVAPVAAAPAEVVAQAQEADTTTDTTATFTRTDSAAVWQAGMDAPQTTSESQTYTYGDTQVAETATAEAVVEAAPSAVVVEAAPAPAESAPVADVFGDPIPQVGAESDASSSAEDGVLAFVAEPEAAPAPTAVEEVQVEQTAQTGYQQSITELDHVSSQHYVDGKLVAAGRADSTLTGEINQLVTDHTSEETLVAAPVEQTEPVGWVDVSPLKVDEAANEATTPSTNGTASDAVATTPEVAPQVELHDGGTGGNGGTDTAGGGLGDGGTNVPGGGLGDGGTNTPGGGLGDGGTGTTGGAGEDPTGVHPLPGEPQPF